VSDAIGLTNTADAVFAVSLAFDPLDVHRGKGRAEKTAFEGVYDA
jgi:hypothetical protein